MKLVSIAIFSLVIIACGPSSTTNSPPPPEAAVASPSPSSGEAQQKVTIDSADGVRLVGSYYASAKPNSPGILLLHQWQSDRHSYDEFAKRLQTRDFAVLSIDGRGFGESTKKTDGTSVAAGRTEADVKAMLGDVDAAITFLQKQQNVDPTRIGMVGASYGSSLAIIYAADHPDIRVVALLSPGLNYFGNMPTRPAVEKYGTRDLVMIAASGDAESAKALDGLTIGTPRHGFMKLPVGSYHGTDLFKYRDKTDGPPVVEDGLESFLTTRFSSDEVKTK